MFPFFLGLMMATLLASSLMAAWPLIAACRLRPLLQGAGGTLCLLAGVIGFFAAASGLVGNAFLDCSAMAAEAADVPRADESSDEARFFATTSLEPATTSEQPTALNVLPQGLTDDVIIPPGRPNWVKSEPARTGSLHTTAVCSGPFKKDSDARAALDAELEAQTAAYISELLGSKLAPQFIRYDAGQIRSELVSADRIYHETIESPTVGPMEQYHALVEFRPEFQERIQRQWSDVKAKWRLAQFGLFAGGAVLLLGTVFGYFRLDNATRGYYTGRLQFVSAAAILAIVGAGVVLARWIAWL